MIIVIWVTMIWITMPWIMKPWTMKPWRTWITAPWTMKPWNTWITAPWTIPTTPIRLLKTETPEASNDRSHHPLVDSQPLPGADARRPARRLGHHRHAAHAAGRHSRSVGRAGHRQDHLSGSRSEEHTSELQSRG